MAGQTAGPYNLQIVRTEADLLALLPEWQALWDGVTSTRATQSPHWALHTWRALAGRGQAELFVVCVRLDGALVGVLPLLLGREGGRKVLRHLGLGFDEFSGVVLRDDIDQAAALDQILSELAAQGDIAKLSIKNLPDESPLSAAMLGRKLAYTRWTKPRAFIRWREDDAWDAYLGRTRSKESLRQRDRRYRKLVRETGAVLVREDDPVQIARTVDWVFRNKAVAYRDRDVGAFITDDAHKAFIVGMAASEDPANPIAVYALKIGDRAIAAIIVGHGKGETAGMIVTHDAEFATFSPGTMVIQQAIMDAFNAREEFDLELGEHDWKRPWMTGTSAVRHIELYLSPRSALLLEPGQILCKQMGRVRGAIAHHVRRLRRRKAA